MFVKGQQGTRKQHEARKAAKVRYLKRKAKKQREIGFWKKRIERCEHKT